MFAAGSGFGLESRRSRSRPGPGPRGLGLRSPGPEAACPMPHVLVPMRAVGAQVSDQTREHDTVTDADTPYTNAYMCKPYTEARKHDSLSRCKGHAS